MPKVWTECHEEVTKRGELAPCDRRPVVGFRSDQVSGYPVTNPQSWYPVCARHAREPMADFWAAVDWVTGPKSPDLSTGEKP